MSQENVQAVQRMYEDFARGDVPAVLERLDPQVDWREAEGFIYADGNPYIGPDAVVTGVFQRLGTEWEGFAAIPEAFFDAGETVVVQGTYRGTYKQTGRSVEAQFVHFYTLQDGRVVKFQQYTDTAQFRQAVSTEQNN